MWVDLSDEGRTSVGEVLKIIRRKRGKQISQLKLLDLCGSNGSYKQNGWGVYVFKKKTYPSMWESVQVGSLSAGYPHISSAEKMTT